LHVGVSTHSHVSMPRPVSRAGPGGQPGNDSDSSAAGSHPERQLFGQATPGPACHRPTARRPNQRHPAEPGFEENPASRLTTAAKRARYGRRQSVRRVRLRKSKRLSFLLARVSGTDGQRAYVCSGCYR
jgi:hypothetical protein